MSESSALPHPMSTWLLVGLMCLFLGASPVLADDSKHMANLTFELGLDALLGNVFISGWIDMDQDGLPEPYYVTDTDIYYLSHADGEFSVKTAVIDTENMPVAHFPVVATLAIDVDRDGTQEIMTIGRGARLFKVVGPGQLAYAGTPVPAFPASRGPIDAAAADLNNDGWPDVTVAMAAFEGGVAVHLGAKDMLLMNRAGSFELVDFPLPEKKLTLSIVAADIDLDGRVDLIESVNYSGISGPDRILLNTTAPGAAMPSFVVAEHTFDSGSFGMGAAVADIDADGYLDIYNTSMGRDFLMLGTADGSFKDATYERGINHEWGSKFSRVQWSPTVVDFNGDGHLDIFVRHGHLGDFQFFGLAATEPEANLMYLQGGDGVFERVPVPFDPGGDGCCTAVAGDANRDGLPDLSLGNTMGAWLDTNLPGVTSTPSFWLNTSPNTAGHRLLTATLRPSVSANPPTGLVAVATCNGQSLSRIQTSGGRMGGDAASQLFFGWPSCDADVTLEVQWPSGAKTLHTHAAGTSQVTLEEPTWYSLKKEGMGWVLYLDPTDVNGEICASMDGETWSCCDEACMTPYAPDTGKRGFVRIGDRAPIALARYGGELLVTTYPSPVAPLNDYTITVKQAGQVGVEDVGAPWIRRSGEKVPWDTEDLANATFGITLTAPADGGATDFTTLLLGTKTQMQMSTPMGFIFDPTRMDAMIYPSENIQTLTTWKLIAAPSISLEYLFTGNLSVRNEDGGLIEGSWKAMLGLLHFEAEWHAIPKNAKLSVYDGDTLRLGPYPVYHQMTADTLSSIVSRAVGFIQRTTVVADGDTNRVFFALLDSNDAPLAPDPTIVTAEIEGGVHLDGPKVLPERPWEITVGFKAEPGAGDGSITIRTTAGKELASWSFNRRLPVKRDLSLEKSYVTLSHDSLPSGVGATAELRIYPLNTYGEMLAGDVELALEAPGLIELGPAEITSGGFYVVPIEVGLYGGIIPISIYLNGELLGIEEIEIIGPALPQAPPGLVSWPGGEAQVDPPTTKPPPTDEGCAVTSRSDGGAPLLLFGLLFLWAWSRHPGRLLQRCFPWVGALLLCIPPTDGRAAPNPQFKDWTEQLGLSSLPDRTFTSGWMDIDLDGFVDPFWVGTGKVYYVPTEQDGTYVLKNTPLGGSGGPADFLPVAGMVVDIDRDGQPELVLATDRLRAFRLTGPAVFTSVDMVSPYFGTAATLATDMACGDFNSDGWPDIAVGLYGHNGQHVYPSGARDIILMNRGGHFERHVIEPSRSAMTHGITVIDVNGDHRPDIVESVDFSEVAGPSRILLNTTEAGADVPTFEVSPQAFDRASFGMGAAVEDINGDGILDIYNTSAGRDFMLYGQADGSYVDTTYTHGIVHEWASHVGRVQWSPAIADLNADGLVDLFIRHGHLPFIDFFPQVTGVPQHDLLYTQDKEGQFHRLPLPFNPEATARGHDAALGDLDRDGFPEVTMGSNIRRLHQGGGADSEKGNPFFWHNVTPKEEGTTRLTVRLKATVSASPPSGAKVTGQCDGVTLTRHIASGGRTGGVPAREVYLAWPGCQSEPELTVAWPSGAVSKHSASAASHYVVAEEPMWWQLVGSSPTFNVQIDLTNTSAPEACVFATDGSTLQCCDTLTSPCAISFDPLANDQWTVSLDGGPSRALPRKHGFFTWFTEPALPRPGEPYDVVVRHGGFGGLLTAGVPWLRYGVDKLAWDTEDLETGSYRLTLTPDPEDIAPSLAFFIETKKAGQWKTPTGFVLDPRYEEIFVYGYETIYPVNKWWLMVASTPGDGNPKSGYLSVKDDAGIPIMGAWSLSVFGLLRFEAMWDAMPSGGKVHLYDGDQVRFENLPVLRDPGVDYWLNMTKGVVGFSSRNTLVRGGDITRLYFTLYDDTGALVRPFPEDVVIETEGLTQEGQVEFAGGTLAYDPLETPQGWDLTAVFRSGNEVGMGKIKIALSNGTPLGEFEVEIRAAANLPWAEEQSLSEVSQSTVPAGVGASADLTIWPRNTYNELLGMDVDVSVEAPPGLRMDPIKITESGFFKTTLYPGLFGGEYPIKVFINGTLQATHTIEVVGQPLPETPYEITGQADASGGDTPVVEPADTAPPDKGCQVDGNALPVPFALLFLLSLLVMGCRRRRRLE